MLNLKVPQWELSQYLLSSEIASDIVGKWSESK